jgi:hypothetical protein
MPIRTQFVRRLAWGLVVTGLVIGLAGEILVIGQELLYGDPLPAPGDDAVRLRLAQDHLWLWPAVMFGAAMAALGLLLLVLYAHLLRQRILAELVRTRDGSEEH